MARLSVAPETTLQCGALKAVLAPAAGGRLTRLMSTDATTGEATDWLVPLDDAVRAGGFEATAWPKAGCYPLVPFSNRIRAGHFVFEGRSVQLPIHPGERHALHGGSHRMPWQLIRQQAQSATMMYLHAEGEHGWPWAFRAEQDVVLDSSGVTLRLRITNESAAAMPCGCGFHPYFPAHFGHRLQFRAGTVWPPTADFLALGPVQVEAQHDYAAPRTLPDLELTQYYGEWDGQATLMSADGRSIRMRAEALAHLVLHRPAGKGYFCVEPVSHVADAANIAQQLGQRTGWQVLLPGETLACSVRIECLAS